MICDFAQYYHVLDWRQLPVGTTAILACGLPAESRLLRAINKQKINIDTLLEAAIADQTAILVWQQTKNGHKNRQRPKSYLKMLLGEHKEESAGKTFKSGEEFEAARRRIIEG